MKQNTLFLQTAALRQKKNKKGTCLSLWTAFYKSLLGPKVPAHPYGRRLQVILTQWWNMKKLDCSFVAPSQPGEKRAGWRPQADPGRLCLWPWNLPGAESSQGLLLVWRRRWKPKSADLEGNSSSNFLNKDHFNIKDFFPVFPVSLFSKCLLAASYLLIFHSGYFLPIFLPQSPHRPTLSISISRDFCWINGVPSQQIQWIFITCFFQCLFTIMK